MISNIGNLTSKTIEGFESINLLFNLDELSHQLEIIEEAISLARLSIPSSRLISLQELSAAQRSLQENGIGADTTDNILNIASAYVIHSQQYLIYVIKIPKVANSVFTLYYVEPIISNNTRIQLSSKYFLKGLTSFSSKTSCPKTRDIYICPTQQLETPIKCVEQLFDGKSSQCPMEKTYGHNFVQKVDNFNIVANDVNMTITSNCSAHNQQLQGSYLIQISNCSIKLNDEEYSNNDIEIPSNPFIPTTGLKVIASKLTDRIPLEHLQELNRQQRDHIIHLNLTAENFHGSLHSLRWLSFSSFTITTVIAMGLVVAWIVRAFIPHKTTLVIDKDELSRDKTEEDLETTSTRPKIIMVPQV